MNFRKHPNYRGHFHKRGESGWRDCQGASSKKTGKSNSASAGFYIVIKPALPEFPYRPGPRQAELYIGPYPAISLYKVHDTVEDQDNHERGNRPCETGQDKDQDRKGMETDRHCSLPRRIETKNSVFFFRIK
ncbi:hypothetical protein MKX64_17425 [Paenibacillus sp. FSL M8-0334]|uniref:hypothetical protein n=1 Tax=Paenibacillus sp. FSL M8-0334 TaxID=2921623 RepID=UPI0030F74961